MLQKTGRNRKTGRSFGRWRAAQRRRKDQGGELLSVRRPGGDGKRRKGYAFADVTGQRFHRLTALYPLDARDKNGSVMWHCRCDCGRELDVSYNNLRYSNQRSCGCRRREHSQELGGLLARVGGTSVDSLKSKKVPKNNTTGVRGVYLIRGRYVAKIVFQKKQYLLGSFDSLEAASRARQEADRLIEKQVVAYYEQWKKRADADSEWAKANPIRIVAGRDEDNRLKLDVYPILEEAEEGQE